MIRLAVIIISLLIFANCGNSNKHNRFISETDTAYSADIRSVSAKINNDPNNPELYYLRGNAFFFEKNFKEAIADIQVALEINNQQPIYHFKLAECMLSLDSANAKVSQEHLESAIKLKPDYSEAKFLLAKLLLARQQYEKAIALYKELEKIPDYRENAMIYESVAYREQKDTTKSLQYIEQVLKENPQNYNATMQYTLMLIAQNNPTAKLWAQKAVNMNEYSDEAWYHLGLLNQKDGAFKTAVENYERALKINPAHILAKYNIAVIESEFENYDNAIKLCYELEEMRNNFDKGHILKGFCYEKLNNKKAAIESYKAALEINPQALLAKEGLMRLK